MFPFSEAATSSHQRSRLGLEKKKKKNLPDLVSAVWPGLGGNNGLGRTHAIAVP